MQPNESQILVPADRRSLILSDTSSQHRSIRTWAQVGKFTAALVTAITIAGAILAAILYAIDTRAKVVSIDDRIKAEVLVQVNDARKELTADYKKTSEELAQVKDALSYDKLMYDLLCASNYDSVLTTYASFRNDVKIEQVPQSLLASIYRSAVSASSQGTRFSFFKIDELEIMEGILRKSSGTCTAITLYNLSTLYCANGNPGKAKVLIISAIDMLMTSAKISNTTPDLTDYYAEYVFISLADPSIPEAKARAESTWASLTALERRMLVPTSRIFMSLESSAFTTLRDSIAVSHGGIAATSYDEFKKKLTGRDFALMQVTKKTSDGKIFTITEFQEIESKSKPLPPVDFEPHEMPGPKKGPMASCCQ